MQDPFTDVDSHEPLQDHLGATTDVTDDNDPFHELQVEGNNDADQGLLLDMPMESMPENTDEDPFHDIPHLDSTEYAEGDMMDDGKEDAASLLGKPTFAGEADGAVEPGYFSMDTYRAYFDVRTIDVAHRLKRALFPMCCFPFLRDEEKPDLYGPFWITTTLVFMMVITANIAERVTSGPEYVYDFRKMTVAAPVFYSYISLVPLVFWYLASKQPNGRSLTLSKAVCLYGYSLLIYIPISVLCIVPNTTAQWSLVFFGCALSSYFLFINFWKSSVEMNTPGTAVSLSVGVAQMTLQVALGLIFKLYFFKYKEV